MGTQLKQGAVYLDLRHPESGPLTAERGVIAAEHNYYTPKAEIPYDQWNRLLDTLCPAVKNEGYSAYVVSSENSSHRS